MAKQPYRYKVNEYSFETKKVIHRYKYYTMDAAITDISELRKRSPTSTYKVYRLQSLVKVCTPDPEPEESGDDDEDEDDAGVATTSE